MARCKCIRERNSYCHRVYESSGIAGPLPGAVPGFSDALQNGTNGVKALSAIGLALSMVMSKCENLCLGICVGKERKRNSTTPRKVFEVQLQSELRDLV